MCNQVKKNIVLFALSTFDLEVGISKKLFEPSLIRRGIKYSINSL